MSKIRKESRQFKTMLKHYLNKLYFKDLDKLSVLDVACGRCNEAEVLLGLFDKVKGIDNNPEKIKRIIERGLKEGQFEVSDARKLSRAIDKLFDIVIVRHPNAFGDEWKKTYKKCYKVTRNKGILISTFIIKMNIYWGGV